MSGYGVLGGWRRSLHALLPAVLIAALGSCDSATDTPSVSAARIEVAPDPATVTLEESVQLRAVVQDGEGNELDGLRLVWSSEDTGIATVSSSGEVTGMATGTVRIAASTGGVSGVASVQVLPKPVARVEIGPSDTTLVVGEEAVLLATPLDEEGEALDDRTATWSSEDPDVAIVDDEGRVTALEPGSATIAVAIDGVSAAAAVTVLRQPVAAVRITPASTTVLVGATRQFTATALDSEDREIGGLDVTWESSDPETLSITPAGLATAHRIGAVDVTATIEGKSATAAVGVGPNPVATVEVTPAEATLVVGGSADLDAIARSEAGDVLTGRSIDWSSSDPDIARVEGAGIVTAVAPGVVTITASVEEKTGTATLTVAAEAVASVEIEPSSLELLVGDSEQLDAVARDDEGEELEGRIITWSSSAPSLVAVDGNGRVTAVGAGEATITASVEGQSATTTVTVAERPVESVEVTPASLTIVVGGSFDFDAVARAGNGDVLTGRPVEWESDETAVATVGPDGVVRAVAAGSTTITATVEGRSGSAAVRVDVQPVATVALAPSSFTLLVGEDRLLAVTARSASGEVLTGRGVIWESSNPDRAVVNASGRVTARAPGVVSITATVEGKTAVSKLTVEQQPVATLEVTPASSVLAVGRTVDLQAVARSSSGQVLSGRSVRWSSDAPGVATVDPATGLVTGVAPGDATITATAEGKSDQAEITVTPEAVDRVQISPTAAALRIEDVLTFTARAFSDRDVELTGRSVAWSSSNPSVVEISASGVATALAIGTADITATVEGKTATAAVAVALQEVARVAVTPSSATLLVGETEDLDATAYSAADAPLSGREVGWASSDESVARVGSSGLVTAVAPGTATITATVEGETGTATITVQPQPVASVEVSPATATLIVGDTRALSATTRSSGGGVLTGRDVDWSTSAAGVATVSTSGVVTAVAPGTATITATSEGKSGSATITVQPVPVASVEVSPSAVTLFVEETETLTATTRSSDDDVLTGRDVDWSTSDEGVATVSAAGVVTAVAEGTATITATSEGKSGTATVTVQPIPVATVEVSPGSLTLIVDGTGDLAAIARSAEGDELTGRTTAWSSDDPDVASVDGSGTVTAIAPGSTAITATIEGKSASASVTVEPKPVATVEVTPASATLTVPDSETFVATLKAADEEVLTGRVVTWSSSDESIATVDGAGVVTGVSPGSVSITASSEGQSGSASVLVEPEPVTSVEVEPASATITEGDTQALVAVTRGGGGNELPGRAVEWSSDDPAVAEVSSGGLVTGVAPGTATITATSEGIAGSAEITVEPEPVASVEVEPAGLTLGLGGSYELAATARSSSGGVLPGRPVEWSSADPGVVAADAGGRIEGLAAGSTTITATVEGVDGAAAVTVVSLSGASLQKIGGDDQDGENASELPNPLIVRLLGGSGQPLAGVLVHWATSSGALTPSEVRTSAEGTASATWTLGGGPPEERYAWAEVATLARVDFTATID